MVSETLSILTFVLPLLVLLIVVIVVPVIIFRQNRQVLKAISNNQEMIIAKMEQDRKLEAGKKVNALMLQAHERVTLFLERIHLVNIIPRLLKPGMRASQFQKLLEDSVREEYEHNMSQQLYISDKAWELTKIAREQVLNLISSAGTKVKGDAPASDLAKQIVTAGIDKEAAAIHDALLALKNDLKEYI